MGWQMLHNFPLGGFSNLERVKFGKVKALDVFQFCLGDEDL
jgi:hypothetical protein